MVDKISVGMLERDFVVNVAFPNKHLWICIWILAMKIFAKATAILVPMLLFHAIASNFVP